MWRVSNPGSSGRPQDHQRALRLGRPEQRPPHDPRCPFCPGGVSDRAPLVLVRPNLEEGGWCACIVENSFPGCTGVEDTVSRLSFGCTTNVSVSLNR
jgi:galactose-1-phosphate uridylyltransferase